MERRLLLVFALTFVVVLGSQILSKKFFPQPAQPQKALPSPAAPNLATPPAAAEAPAPAPSSQKASSGKQATSENEVIVENNLYKITFTNRGAEVKSWVLKKFNDDLGQPLDLVNSVASEKYGFPLALWLYDEGLRNHVKSALYTTSQSGALKAPADLTFEYSDGEVSVRKTLHFDDSYVVGLETSVQSHGANIAAYPMWPAGFGDQTTPGSHGAQKSFGRTSSYFGQIAYQYNGDTQRVDIRKVSGGNTIRGPFNWFGVTDQYFAAVFIPDDIENSAAVTLRSPLDVPKTMEANSESTRVEVLGVAVGDSQGSTKQRLYVGPKSLPVLQTVGLKRISDAEPNLTALVNFGFFGLIARPLFLWLKWTYNWPFVQNWGWAICIQTLIINLVLLPLRISSMKSALKMQRLQPQMNAIKDKYKKYTIRDPRRQEMNTEIGALMKKEGVSPLGGCLPLVVQMPFLFAYYSMLGAAVDLRHAHWLWVRDLSSADPWHILPIGIIITMLFTQRMTPQAGMDPAQQKMMNLIMPAMLGIMSWSLAAGLCLYWSEGNLIALAQQSIMNKTSLGREMREMALKRARKQNK